MGFDFLFGEWRADARLQGIKAHPLTLFDCLYIPHLFTKRQSWSRAGESGRKREKKDKKKEGTAGIFSFEETALLPF
jgi:hypothetical protein